MRGTTLMGLMAGAAVTVVVCGGMSAAQPDPRLKREALPVMGACCLPDHSCLMMYKPDCDEAAGTWWGPNARCEDFNCNPPCPADFDSSGSVDGDDLRYFFGCFEHGDCPDGMTADLNGDGNLDDQDIVAFLDALLSGVC
ncbi:MAG: hypothetical protein ACOYN0_13550 [Phycisphaerales bacterium]